MCVMVGMSAQPFSPCLFDFLQKNSLLVGWVSTLFFNYLIRHYPRSNKEKQYNYYTVKKNSIIYNLQTANCKQVSSNNLLVLNADIN